MTTHRTLELSRYEQLLPIEEKAKPIVCRQDIPTKNTIFKDGEVIPAQQLSDLTRMLVSSPHLNASVYIPPMDVATPDHGLLRRLRVLEKNTDLEIAIPEQYDYHGDPSRVCFSLAEDESSDSRSRYLIDQPIRPLSIDEGAWFVADDVGVIGDIPVLIDSRTMTGVSLKDGEGIHVSGANPGDIPGYILNDLLEQKTRVLRESTVRTIGATLYCRAIEVEEGRHIL